MLKVNKYKVEREYKEKEKEEKLGKNPENYLFWFWREF